MAPSAQLFNGIAFGAGLFVASTYAYVGPNYYHGLATSPDGTNWTQRYSQLNGSVNKVRYLNGHFIAVGSHIIVSVDGTNWTSQNLVTDGPAVLWDVAYGEGDYVAAGWNYSQAPKTILTSFDGINWTARSAGTNNYLNGVCYGNRRFIAVGFGGVIVSSAPFSD